MNTKSNLDIVALPTLIQSIADESKTGTLKIENNLGEKTIYLRDGKVLQVTSPEKPSMLAEGLRRHPELDEESYQLLCKQQMKTGNSLASIILNEENGLALLTVICQFQILEEMCELFTWENCHSEFIDGEPDPMNFDLEIINIEPMNISSLLLEGARRLDEWNIIRQYIPSRQDIPEKLVEKLEEASYEKQTVFQAIDGFQNINEILSKLRLSAFVAESTLSELIQEKVIALKDGKALLQLATLDIFREDIEKRIKLYERAIELGEQNTEIIEWLAHSYETLGKKDKAANQYWNLGTYHLSNGDYIEASHVLEKVTNLIPDYYTAQECLLSLLNKLKQYEKFARRTNLYARKLVLENEQTRAIILLQEAMQKYTENLENLDLLGSLYQEQGFVQDAIQSYKKVANIRYQKQEWDSVARMYNKILYITPEDIDARATLGEVYIKLERYKDAFEQYQSVGKQIFRQDEIKPEYSELLCSVSQYILDAEPNHHIARKWLAYSYKQTGQKQEAIEQFQEILKRIHAQEESELLLETLQNLVKLNPQNLEFRQQLAVAYITMKKQKEGIQEYFALGTEALQQNKEIIALEAFDTLLSYDPANYATHIKKAEILQKTNQNDKAIQEFMLTGYLSIGANKLWQAISSFAQVLKIDKNSHPECYQELGKLYSQLNKPEEACKAYKRHIQVSIKQHNYGTALQSCQAILEIAPEHAWAKKALHKLSNTVYPF